MGVFRHQCCGWCLELLDFLEKIIYLRERIFILTVYVDNILILASEEEIKGLHRLAVNEFQWVTLEEEKLQSYLGMQI